jgi:hypothetical protein
MCFRDGVPISAHEFIPGSKEEPFKLKAGAVQRDGLAMEINPNPAKTAEEFEHNVTETLREACKFLPEGVNIGFTPSVVFDSSYFDMLPEKVKELGCNPDFNAYNALINPPPDTSPFPTMRTTAGHIQIGWTASVDKADQHHFDDCCIVIKGCDHAYETIRPTIDKDTKRQSLYGKLGAFRPTPFGVEHRVPSCAWVEYPRLYPFMFDLYSTAFANLQGEDKPLPVLTPWHLEQKWAH